MSISHKQLMALRRAHMAEKQQTQQQPAPTPAPAGTAPAATPAGGGATHSDAVARPFMPVRPAGGGAGAGGGTRLSRPSEADKARLKANPAIHPKVFAPTETVRGQVPRDELIRRARALYDQGNLEQLLADRGIDYWRDGVGGTVESVKAQAAAGGAGAVSYHKLLPLEAFDDYSVDPLAPKDWMAKGIDAATEEQVGLPCSAVRVEDGTPGGRGRWVQGKVLQWSEEEQRLLVQWDDAAAPSKWMPRVYVCFKAEDPTTFVDRVAAAHERRMEAERVLRFHLSVDSMPVDDSQVIDAEVAERIRDISINTTALLNNEDNLDVAAVLREINADYGRSANRLIFENAANDPALSQIFKQTPIPRVVSEETNPPVPEYGQAQLPPHNFAAVLRAFHANTYLNKQDEVILTLQRVREECDQILLTNIFVVPPQIDSMRPLLLSDYDESQTMSITNRVQMLREQWCGNLREHVRDSLKATNETNEVNLNVHSKDQYYGTKLQRLMHTIKYMMQDTLYYLVTASLESYVRFVEDACNYTTTITDLANVSVAPGPFETRDVEMGHDRRPRTGLVEAKLELPPLFRVSLKQGEDSLPTYSTTAQDFLAVIIAIYDKGITHHQEIPQLEQQVLEFVYSPQAPMVQSIGLHHALSVKWRERLTAAVQHATAPLDGYLATYKEFHDLLAINIDEYVKEFAAANHKVQFMEKEAQRHLDREQHVNATIPESVNLGAFQVDCSEFRTKLAEKCATLAQRVLDQMAKVARSKADEVDDKFSGIRSVLIRPMDTPEDIVRIRDFIKKIPDEVFDLQVIINEMRSVYDTLDGFRYHLHDEDFGKKWKAIGWPSRLDEDVVRTQQTLELQRRLLLEQHEKDHDAYSKEAEKLGRLVLGFYKRTDIKKLTDTVEEVRKLLSDIQKLKEDAARLTLHQNLFDKPDKQDYSLPNQISKDFEPYATLWLTADDWTKWHKAWHEDPFETIDAEEMEKNVIQAGKNMVKVLREPKFREKAPILKIAEDIKAQIDEFKPILPTVKCLRMEGMKERHWQQLSKELGFDVTPGETLSSLPDVYQLDLQLHEQTLVRISEVAAREYQIEQMLAKMRKDWEPMTLGVKAYKRTGCFIMGKDTVDDTQELLDEHMLNTQALNFSPFKKMFETQIEEWDAILKKIQAIFDEWKTCQKAWMYLEPIFQSDDIVRQLPNEYKDFVEVNKTWKKLTMRANECPNTLEYATTTESVLDNFVKNNTMLDKIQKGLNQYLENKRSSFARFYFLSDDELLTILSEAKDPQKIQAHFRKLFENISELEMLKGDNEMKGMYSQMGEYVPFKESVYPRKNVENWLSEVESMMKRSLRQECENGMTDIIKKGRKDFILEACGQIAIAVSQVFWTAACEKSLNETGSLKGYVDDAQKQLMMLVETVRQKLKPVQQVNLGGLITIEVHARDIVEKLAEENVDSVFAFEWVSQLRSYWMDDVLKLRQVEAEFIYGCEYLGNTSRLVITPLTDRIYLTLTGAMHMFLGSAPAGPAGTGKTETVKDLAKAVSKQCVVFNCQEGMTFQSMGKFFKGLANSGAWACFDEFNRIDVEVLSVVAQQVSSLQEAARTKNYRIAFEGTEIVVDPTYSVFITMNPGYAGRTELPDNLKVLFRPVACMVPNYAMIGEIRLFSYGYEHARPLSKKMVATFKLSSEQLSAQHHYDFGMRAVNTVISAAGLMKRNFPDDDEDLLLLRALRDSNSPKFLKDDLILFNGIISDLFPTVKVPPPDYGLFLSTLREKCEENKLQATEMFTKKCIELYEMTVLRHGQMAVGPTMGGKSSAIKVLQQAMTKLRNEHNEERFHEVWTYHLNPKSVTMSQLYGGFDDATGEWRDGLIGELFRIAAADKQEIKKWIIFDGPVDALWIESMNTVLDENKKLCLISGEIIAMTQHMNIWFEVEDLAVASPATVSRAGMIYLEPTYCIGVESFLKSWCDFALPKTMDPHLESMSELLTNIVPPLLQFVATQCTEYQKTVWPNLLRSMFRIFDGFMEPFTPTRTFDPPTEKLELLADVHLHLLVFSIVWSIGGATDLPSRKKFDKFLRDELRRAGCTIQLPDLGLLYDFEYSVDDRRWVQWVERAPEFKATVSPSTFSELIVPTADVQRYSWLMRHLLVKGAHVLAVGPTGTGKTLIINEMLMRSMPENCTPIFFTFSARTGANQTQDLLFSKFEPRRRASPAIYGAPVEKKFMIFIDDVNMPLREKYGAQPPVELLRQWMDYGGWYDRKLREFYSVVDTIYVGAMGPPGGGRNPVSNRFLRHFNFISFPDIDDENVTLIFNTIMQKFFSSNGFNEDVKARLSSLIAASIEMFSTISKELRPRPSRPHYLFNLRDVAKIFSGLLNAESKTVSTANAVVGMWAHEATRTFRDRLVDDEDRTWFDELLKKQLNKHFKLKWSDVCHSDRLMYVDFLNQNADVRQYLEVKDMSALTRIAEHHLAEFNNNTTKKMNLVLFMDAIEHVSRIARIVRKPGGHALLLGVGGSGRQSLSKLAAHISEFEVEQVEITKGYSMNTWRDDMRRILKDTAFKQQQCVFIITDTQIVHEGMLEDVNNLLNSGEVPNLFVGPDVDEILQKMKPICVAENIPLDKVNVYARFVKMCRDNLHMVVCMSPLGEPFRNRLRMFPALVSCCTIDWFSSWPEEALESVAREFFKENEHLRDEIVTKQCVEMCVYIHQTVEEMSTTFLDETKRHNYVTPTSYLDLLTTFVGLLSQETTQVATQKNRLVKGLETLRETEVQIAELQANLERDQPLLIQRKEDISRMVEEIAAETEAAEETKQAAVADEKAATEKTDQCTVMFEESEAMLAQAKPLLDEALDALGLLKPGQFTEVNSYKVFSSGVQMTLEAVCVLLGVKPVMKATNPQFPDRKEPDYTPGAKELLGKPNVLLDKLLNYNRDNIPDKTIKNIEKFVSSEDFTPAKIRSASSACAAMCSWVHAMYKYHFVAKEVQPLRDSLAIAKQELDAVTEKLNVARDRLRAVEEKLAGLEANKRQAEEEMAELEAKVKMTETKLRRAGMLIDGLAGEKKNWLATVARLTEREQYLIGDILCAAGQVSYVGAFTTKYRNQLLAQWRTKLGALGVRHSEQLSVFHTLQDPIETRNWNVDGLPSDVLSIENAIILKNSRRWPLMIDPQQQANKWIRKTYGDSLEILKPSTKDLIKRIENAIRAGRPALLENVTDELDPSLDPLLQKQTYMRGTTLMIRISENEIAWNKDFKFFMTTKHTNPHYIPEVMVKVTLLNFFITPSGLEDQLLGCLVGIERRELETQKNALVQQNAAMRTEAARIQSEILQQLDEVEGDILDDEALIENLDQSKVKTKEIEEKVAEAEITEKAIDETREGYRPMAYHSSILYFCCADLANIDPMYQYALQWFVSLFEAGIEGAEKSEDLQERLTNLKDYFTFAFFQNISRSVFEKHKLLFAFVLCIRILKGRDEVDFTEWRFLISGAASQVTAPANPAPEWLTEVTWQEFAYIDQMLPAFKGLCKHVASNVKHYEALFMSASAHREELAGEWKGKLSPMQQLIFVRCLRADKLMNAVQDFIAHYIGDRFIKPPSFDLPTSYKDSTPTTPLIFVLSAGADPLEELKKFADVMKMSKRWSEISLGQGQGPRAERLLREGTEVGNWVLLQNCHLATSWMPTLERLVEAMGQGINPAFRLWLTSMPNPHFPVSILQNGVKMTNEPPKGMRANVSRSLATYSTEYLERCDKPPIFKKLMFALCFFHALIQERRKFGPLGWNIAYEYTSGDLGCCIQQTKMFLDKYDEVPYRVIRELSGQIHYGGRVTDDWDRRTLTTILEGFVLPEVLNDDYKFSPSGRYLSVKCDTQADYLQNVANWDINTHPEVFGLHENADITCARNETFDTLTAIVIFEGTGGGGKSAGKSPDEIVTDLSKSILSKIRAEFDAAAFYAKFPTKYEDSMNTVVFQEVIRFNQLLRVLRSSLENLILAIQGMVVMSKELDEVYQALQLNIVPTTWADVGYPSLKPLAGWVTDLAQRLAMLEQWYDQGHPKAYWISGFYFPQAFLTGILQNHARARQISIDTISYGFEWISKSVDEIKQAPPTGCYIHGMYIEGARVDSNSLALAESRPKVLFETAPIVWLIPTVKREDPTSGVYHCPLYKTLRRAGTLSTTGHSTNYVLTLEVPSAEPEEHWVKRGVAMVCALNY